MAGDCIRREDARRMVVQLDKYAWKSPVSDERRVTVDVDLVKFGLDRIPAADVAEVVRCENCEFSRELTKTEKRIWLDECRACENPEASQDGYMIVFPEHFCSYGRRREGGNDNVSD